MAKRQTDITVEYDATRKRINTGDIILFSGKGGISNTIKWFTGSDWSHVGMAMRLPRYDLVLLWESTTLGDIKEYDSDKLVNGVRLVVLSEAVKKYDGKIVVRHLDIECSDAMLDALWRFRDQVRGRPYERNKLELIRSAYDGVWGENTEDLSSIFCSELIAETYQVMGLLPETPASNEYTPNDFSTDATEPLRLLKGAALGNEIPLTSD